jgi:uncharacterized membrane protein YgaE (UPF0421/DUF939 family)
MKAPPLITRTDLRLALTAGLSAGLVIVLGLPDAFYAPLAVGAALGGTVGATRLLGTQRVLGTLLGGVIVAIGFNTMGQALPLPLGVGVALALTRIFGGSLGLRSGYKVAGLVVSMGWTLHHTNLASWIPTRLVVTLIGVLAAWLAVSQIWPSRALEQHQEHSQRLFSEIATLLRERARLLLEERELAASARLQRRNQLVNATIQLQNQRQEANQELGPDRMGERMQRLWDLQEKWLSAVISHYRTMLRLPVVPLSSPGLKALMEAEHSLLQDLADQLDGWAQVWPSAPPLGANAAAGPDLERLEQAETSAFQDPLATAVLLGSSGGRRAITCHQLVEATRGFEAAWAAVP